MDDEHDAHEGEDEDEYDTMPPGLLGCAHRSGKAVRRERKS